MNIFIRELKAHRKSLIIWCIGAFYMVAASMWKFGTEYSSNQSLNELISQLPEAVRVILGIRGSFDLSTVGGYYGLLYYYLVLMATIHSTMIGASIISKEEQNKTTEFIISKPVTRNEIITSKLFAGIANIFIFNLVTTLSSIIMVQYYNNGQSITKEIIMLMIGMFILQLMFLLLGTALAAISKNPKISSAAALTILLITLMLAKVIDMNSKLEGLKYFTPIKYFEAEQLLLQGGFNPTFLALCIFIIAILFRSSYVFYNKRDLNV
jgi:ABC-2 type transport system permease protein